MSDMAGRNHQYNSEIIQAKFYLGYPGLAEPKLNQLPRVRFAGDGCAKGRPPTVLTAPPRRCVMQRSRKPLWWVATRDKGPDVQEQGRRAKLSIEPVMCLV
jgi:hypothetical protein